MFNERFDVVKTLIRQRGVVARPTNGIFLENFLRDSTTATISRLTQSTIFHTIPFGHGLINFFKYFIGNQNKFT